MTDCTQRTSRAYWYHIIGANTSAWKFRYPLIISPWSVSIGLGLFQREAAPETTAPANRNKNRLRWKPNTKRDRRFRSTAVSE